MSDNKHSLDDISSFLSAQGGDSAMSFASFDHGLSENANNGSLNLSNDAQVTNLAGFPGSESVLSLGLSLPQPEPGTPAAEFRANIQAALTEHLPQLAALAQAVVDGIDRAYEPDVNPNKTASDYNSLIVMAAQFYEFLRETGVGALPMLPLPKPTSDDSDAMTLDLIAPTVVNVPEEDLRTRLNAEVDARYARQRRVMEHAAIVVNRNATKMTL